MSEAWRVCINTQTPLLQYLDPGLARTVGRDDRPLDLGSYHEGTDYRVSPGGVTRMVLPLLRRLGEMGAIRDPHWVSLNAKGPKSVRYDGLVLHNVEMSRLRMAGYGTIKEAVWRVAHGTRTSKGPDELLWTADFSEFAYYNRATAELLRRLDEANDFDVYYVHDFQQLPVGSMLSRAKPKIFRWHIPFEKGMIPPDWRSTFEEYLRHYDMVIMSTDRYLRALRDFGYKGPAKRMFPYVDPKDYTFPSPKEAQAVCAKWGIHPKDQVILVVGRMDPMKGQDVAIQAFATLASSFPRAKLVLVGNGSFSSSRAGLALTKGGAWRAGLEQMIKDLGLEGRVVLTGHVTQPELDALYERSLFTVLPSHREGFGLVVVESWLHRRATVVSDRAGITELLHPGKNGLVFDPTKVSSLAQDLHVLLDDSGELRRRLAEEGYRTAGPCLLDAAAGEEVAMIKEVVGP